MVLIKHEENKICRKLIKNLKSTEACRIVGLQIRGVGAYAPFHNLPLMKFKIIYFCPWWKMFHGGIRGIRLSLVILRCSIPHPPHVCYAQEGRSLLGGQKIFHCPSGAILLLMKIFLPPLPLKMESAPGRKILGTPLLEQ